ncbi:hypothetical protein [Paraherbaspirillum soli]|uniref:Uncharacterized protein n=1 Tax=Paraherbaspirillum soli TaxID=631222 RepID=A0ABW0MAN4_9BURK
MNTPAKVAHGTAAPRPSAIKDKEKIKQAPRDASASVSLQESLAANQEPISCLPEPALVAGAEAVVSAIDAALTADGLAWLIADLTGGAGTASAIVAGGARPASEIDIDSAGARPTSVIGTDAPFGADDLPPPVEVVGISDRTAYLAMSGATGSVSLRAPLLSKRHEAIPAVKPSKRGASDDRDYLDVSDPSDALDCGGYHADGDGGLL